MREILFRGKRIDNDEWVYGFYTQVGEKYHCMLTGELSIMGNVTTFDHVSVIPETVGQYTGLTDKNGNKIFEGDILTTDSDKTNFAVVKYNENKASFYVEDEDHEEYLGEAWDTDVIVIGNIHDNKLEVQNG